MTENARLAARTAPAAREGVDDSLRAIVQRGEQRLELRLEQLLGRRTPPERA